MASNKGSAHWEGSIKEGSGKLSTDSGALKDQPYGFNTRFGDAPGTNPEELIGAAHAGCYSMALSKMLSEAGVTDIVVDTTSEITLDAQTLTITKAHLVTKVSAKGDRKVIEDCAHKAEKGCPVSKVLNAEISLDLTVA